MKWCNKCNDYHLITSDDNQLWELDGIYYFRKDGIVHDVTALIKSGNVTHAINNFVGLLSEIQQNDPTSNTTSEATNTVQKKKGTRTKRR